LLTKRIRSVLCLVVAVLALLSACGAAAQQLSEKLQNAVGHWQTFDGDGKPKGQVETYIVSGKLFGKVSQVSPEHADHVFCEKCSGDFKDQRILGMVNLRNFHPEGDDWVGGTVVDPENGKEYKGKIWTVGKDELHLRGFIGISLLGRTEVWRRIQ